jgi:DNA-binding response OmpR family regulator
MAEQRILIVDDEKLERETLSRILELEGYQVIAASSAEEGYELLKTRQIDLMIADLKMPGMDGGELLIRAMDTYPNLPVIVLTAHGTLESVIDALRRRVHDYILKPARPEEIISSIERALKPTTPSDVAAAEARGKYTVGLSETTVFELKNGVTIDTRKQMISWNDSAVFLTPTEARFLSVLMQQFDRVVSYTDIVFMIHNYRIVNHEAAAVLRPLVSRLRQKLEAVPGGRQMLRTVRSAGYLIQNVN